MRLRIPPEAGELLTRPVAVALQWETPHGTVRSNTIFVCNRVALAAELSESTSSVSVTRIAALDLQDQEIEALLRELEAALVIGPASVWRLAGNPETAAADDGDGEGERLRYEDIDYDILRQHPKIQQYIRWNTGQRRYARTKLQMILTAITDHFRGLIEPETSTKSVEKVPEPTQAEEDEADMGHQAGRDAGEKQDKRARRRQSLSKRTSRMFKSFIRRYLKGIRSEAFQQLVGFEVMAQNYVIFSHLLWLLLTREWIGPQFILESSLEIWVFYWGTGSSGGYFGHLAKEQRQRLETTLNQGGVWEKMIASLYSGARLTRNSEHDLRLKLRDFLRDLLSSAWFGMTPGLLTSNTAIMGELISRDIPTTRVAAEELGRLARFETDESFLRDVEQSLGLPSHSCRFDRAIILDHQVKCLVVNSTSPLESLDASLDLLRRWMGFEHLIYYRIAAPRSQQSDKMLLYRLLEASGVYWDKEGGHAPVSFAHVSVVTPPWEHMLAQLNGLAVSLQIAMRCPEATAGVA